MKRYVLEGEWSGYRSGQRRVVHREVVKTSKPERYQNLRGITYSDGTTLHITFRECAPRERVEQKHGYKSLISQAIMTGDSWVNVRNLA